MRPDFGVPEFLRVDNVGRTSINFFRNHYIILWNFIGFRFDTDIKLFSDPRIIPGFIRHLLKAIMEIAIHLSVFSSSSLKLPN